MARGKRRPASGSVSAGVLLYRLEAGLQVLIAHPGGPFWRNRDNGAWSIPKGLLKEGESPLDAARREFSEETGLTLPDTGFLDLDTIVQRGGKTVHAWAIEGDADIESLVSNTYSMEWPPRTGRIAEFPEMDRFLWADRSMARQKLNRAQAPLVDRLTQRLHDK
jgi:predicted NUDIX family NTP pyrophosphohydrolase